MWKWVFETITLLAGLAIVMEYLGITFPMLTRWGTLVLSSEVLNMISGLLMVAAILIGGIRINRMEKRFIEVEKKIIENEHKLKSYLFIGTPREDPPKQR